MSNASTQSEIKRHPEENSMNYCEVIDGVPIRLHSGGQIYDFETAAKLIDRQHRDIFRLQADLAKIKEDLRCVTLDRDSWRQQSRTNKIALIKADIELDALNKALERIKRVACGEDQLEDEEALDDTQALGWIYRVALATLAALSAPVAAVPPGKTDTERLNWLEHWLTEARMEHDKELKELGSVCAERDGLKSFIRQIFGPKYDREMEVIRISAKVVTLEPTRDERQAGVGQWCVDAFGSGHASSIPQRGLRNIEEAIETAQSAGCERSMVHQLVDHVFDRPPGALNQEIGGQGLTLLALAQAAKLSADAEEAREFARVLSKPLSWFHERNQAKNEAGFDVSAYPVSAPPVALTASSQCDGCGGTRTTYVGEDGTRGTYPKPCPKCCGSESVSTATQTAEGKE